MIIDVERFGARGDGTTLNTQAFQEALDLVRKTGGGVVRIAPGIYKTGTLKIYSNTTLEISPGAVVQGSTDLTDYPVSNPVGEEGRRPFYNKDLTDRHLLLAHKAENVTITGGGCIDGMGESFWEPQVKPETWIREKVGKRPSPMIEMIHCTDLRIQNITICNSPGWTVGLTNCDRVMITNVRVANNFWGPNTDAFDLCGCRDVLITGCHVEAGDDAFCIKTMPHTRSSERITITNCTMKTNCVGLKLGCAESHKDMRSITFTNCVVYNSTRAVGIYNLRGAIFEDIVISNIVCDTINAMPLNRPIHIDLRHVEDANDPPSTAGLVRNVIISNFIANTDGRILMTAADGCRMENITLSDVQLRYSKVDNPFPRGRDAKSSQFSNHSPEARIAPGAIVADGIDGLVVRGAGVFWPSDTEKPSMHALWLRNCPNTHIDSPALRASDSSMEAVKTTD